MDASIRSKTSVFHNSLLSECKSLRPYSFVQATVRPARNGVYKSNACGEINFNADLARPILDGISMQWETLFDSTIIDRLKYALASHTVLQICDRKPFTDVCKSLRSRPDRQLWYHLYVWCNK